MLNHKTILDAFGPNAWRVASKLRNLYWRVVRPVRIGISAIIENDACEVFLVKHSYEKGWCCVSGGVERGESFEEALRREVAEETSLTVNSTKLLQIVYRRLRGAHVHGALYHVRASGQFKIDGTEIIEGKWFSRADLPPDLEPISAIILQGAAAPQRLTPKT